MPPQDYGSDARWEHRDGQTCHGPEPCGPDVGQQPHYSRRPVTAWLRSARDSDTRPSHLGGSRTAGEVMAILLDEQIHHGAEIALLATFTVGLGPDPGSWHARSRVG